MTQCCVAYWYNSDITFGNVEVMKLTAVTFSGYYCTNLVQYMHTVRAFAWARLTIMHYISNEVVCRVLVLATHVR